MDQRELMRPGDGVNSERFSLVLVMHLKDLDNLMKESREFGAIVTDWYKTRNASAEGVTLIAVSSPVYHSEIRKWFEGVRALDVTLRPIFDAIGFALSLHDSQGAKLGECSFAAGEASSGIGVEQIIAGAQNHMPPTCTTKSRRWWRFWGNPN